MAAVNSGGCVARSVTHGGLRLGGSVILIITHLAWRGVGHYSSVSRLAWLARLKR